MKTPPVVLSIAGHDPSSGAGITADIKTAAALGCYAATCITALTVQSTRGVMAVEPVRPELVARTLEALADDLPIAAVRLGMLGSAEVADVVADFLEGHRLPNVVLDPVTRSSSGAELLDPAGVAVLRRRLLPLCDIVAPNLEEAAVLAGADPLALGKTWEDIAPRLLVLADKIHRLGARAVVITGGHLNPPNDLLSYIQDGLRQEQVFPGIRIESHSTHGTGCAFATAIACGLVQGRDLPEAVRGAKEFVRRAIKAAYPLGKGVGPMNHLFRLRD